MADFSVKSAKKKRKALILDEKDQPSKALRGDGSRERKKAQGVADEGGSSAREEFGVVDEGGRGPWRNLELILLLQNKEVELSKKVEVAFNYVNGRGKEGVDEEFETVKVARLVVFLINWVQSLLISTDKKLEGNEGELREACLDYRCWVILKFCLEESLRSQASLTFSRNLLRALGCVARNMSLHSAESSPVGDELDFRTVIFDCASSMFVSHGGLSNENLDLWISTVQTVLELVKGIYQEKCDRGDADVLALKFSCLVLQAFSKFLRVHPTRKNGFRDFVDGLLDPLLCLLGILNHKLDGNNPGITGKLLSAVEEILAHGLFHPIHIEGFLSLQSAGKYSSSNVDDQKATRTVLRSYHRHFFEKLEKVMAAKNESSLNGLGQLFRLLVDCVKRHKMAPLLYDDARKIEKTESSNHVSVTESKMLQGCLNAEKRKSIFDFFVEIMEPLLLEMDVYIQAKSDWDPLLLDVHSTMKSINELLACFLREKLYVKTEEASGGAYLNFLKKVYDTVVSFATNFLQFFTYDMDAKEKIFNLLAREVVVAVGYLLEIEYEVTGNDLTSLWHMILSYFAVGHTFKSASDQDSITFLVIGLGCQLIKLYSELRQVTTAISTLCKAIRLLLTHDNVADENRKRYNRLSSSCFSHDTYGKTLGLLLSSQEFRLALHNAIKSLPEGQASDCVQKVCIDVSESIQWIKDSGSMEDLIKCDKMSPGSCRTHFDIQEEIFGRLSEVYMVVLDSLNVTAGNCNLVEQSLRDLVSTISPCMSILVGLESDNVHQFLYSVTGRCRSENDPLKCGMSAHWVFLFFCQLFMSCRSLYRQVISLMPPSLARKMSEAMGDSHTAYCGKDWMARTEWTFEGYFSWIHQPSASLLGIIQSISDICFGGRIVDSCPLGYIFHAMALQRLVDLNRQLKSLEYILENNDKIVKNKLVDDTGSSLYRKRSRKLGKRISVLKQEATDLTEYVMSYLSLVVGDQISVDVSTPERSCPIEAFHEPYQWDWSVSSIHKASLPIALWWILCRNINVWSNHASKKKLKIFLSYMIRSSLLCNGSSTMQVGKQHGNAAHLLSKISLHQISSELIMDSNLYEHKFVCRLFTSRFCHLLDKSALSLFSEFMIMDVDLSSSPDWQEVLNILENLPAVIPRSKQLGGFSNAEKGVQEGFEMHPHSSEELIEFKSTACQKLLSLLCWVPKGCVNSRSFSLLMNYVLNLERLIIGYLLNCHTNWSYKQQEALKLFMCCRRALRYTIMAFCEEGVGQQSSDIPVLSGSIHVIQWLLKSVSFAVGLQETLPQDSVDEARGPIFSMMDHTSYIFLTLSKYQSSWASRSSLAWKTSKQHFASSLAQEQSTSTKSDPCSDHPEESIALKSFLLLSESLKKESANLLDSLNVYHCNGNLDDEVGAANLHKLSTQVSCFGGFLWGLASALDDSQVTDNKPQEKFLGSKSDLKATVRSCINVFSDTVRVCLHMFQADNKHQPESISDPHNYHKPDESGGLLDAWKLSLKTSVETDISCCMHHAKCQRQKDERETPDIGRMSQNTLSKDQHSTTSGLNNVDSFLRSSWQRYPLQSLIEGSHPEAGNLIRQLLLVSSAILKLNLQMKSKTCSALVSSSISISEVLLLKFIAIHEVPKPYSFIWLDGVLKYLQELGSQICTTSSASAADPYTRLVELLLKAVGKCISLQGKEANLASHDTETSSKVIPGHSGSPEVSFTHGPLYLDEFKARLRGSFQVLVRKSAEWHLLSAVQTIERALVGVHESYAVIYQITIGGPNGGKVSPTVAAGIDCLDLVLEYVSGTKQLNVVKKHIQSLLSTLFNIILHLQGPSIFTRREASIRDDCPDPGAVILMCVEVVMRVSAKSSLFHMDSSHVAQSLRAPAALFEDFSQLRCLVMTKNRPSHVDRRFSVELYAACCRLLCTVLKYHRSETERCIALLQESAGVLLNCLEMIDTDSGSKGGYFSWNTDEGVKCACFFRRIYEELRQQRDVFGQYCCKFLSSYISVYSGMGPHKSGIQREVDEALKPGVYALIDACPTEDLQSLHDVFGEGPCRNTLAALQHDYKLNFQYEGKV